MIRVDKNGVHIEGTQLDIMTEVSTLIFYLTRENIVGPDELQECVELGMMSEEEMDRKRDELMNECKRFIDDLLYNGMNHPSNFDAMMDVVNNLKKGMDSDE